VAFSRRLIGSSSLRSFITPHPHVGGLIFHPSAELADGNAAALVDAALAYHAIAP
jgi:hypothetical protein